MWAASRRTGLFIVSYVPLAAMFVVLKWPVGWDAGQLIRLAAAVLAASALLLLVPALVTITGRVVRAGVLLTLAAALALVIVAALNGWFEPFGLRPDGHRTSAATTALAFGFASLGLMLVALLLYNAHRAGGVHWTVSDSSEQGGAVAGYLASYLLPLLAVGVVTRRLTSGTPLDTAGPVADEPHFASSTFALRRTAPVPPLPARGRRVAASARPGGVTRGC